MRRGTLPAEIMAMSLEERLDAPHNGYCNRHAHICELHHDDILAIWYVGRRFGYWKSRRNDRYAGDGSDALIGHLPCLWSNEHGETSIRDRHPSVNRRCRDEGNNSDHLSLGPFAVEDS